MMERQRVLDYVLTENFVNQFIKRCSIEASCKIESDHRLVVADLETPCTKQARWKKRTVKEKPRNLKELERKEIKDLFVKELANKMTIAKELESINIKSENIVSALKEAAQNTIPPKSSNCTHEIWKNDDVLNEYLEVRANLERDTPRYKETSKQIKKRVRYLRNQKLQMEAEELNRFASKRQIENLHLKPMQTTTR